MDASGLSLSNNRCLGVVGIFEPLPANDLARQAIRNKGQVRLTAALELARHGVPCVQL